MDTLTTHTIHRADGNVDLRYVFPESGVGVFVAAIAIRAARIVFRNAGFAVLVIRAGARATIAIGITASAATVAAAALLVAAAGACAALPVVLAAGAIA